MHLSIDNVNTICIFTSIKTKKNMENLLTSSIEKRALELIAEGMDIIEAVKKALIDESNMIGSLITSSSRLTEKGMIARDHLFNNFNNSNN